MGPTSPDAAYATCPRKGSPRGPKRARSIGAPGRLSNSISTPRARDLHGAQRRCRGKRPQHAPWGEHAEDSVQLDLYVDARRQLELHERVHRLVGRVHDIHEALVRAQLELVTRVLVGVR